MNKNNSFKRVCIILFFISFSYGDIFASGGSSVTIENNAAKNINECISKSSHNGFEYKKNIQNLYDKIELLSSTITKLRIENIELKNEIEKKFSYTKLMSSSKFGDAIGEISALIGLLTFVFTGLVFMTGISYFNSYKAEKRQALEFEKIKKSLTQSTMAKIEDDLIKKIEEKIVPEIKNKIKNLEFNFWTLTNIARKLESVYWQELKEVKDIRLALNRNNKFKLAISDILSQEDVDQGLGFLFNLKITKNLNFMEVPLYLFYNNGLFNGYEESFSRLIKEKFHMDLKPWLERVKKRLKEEEYSL